MSTTSTNSWSRLCRCGFYPLGSLNTNRATMPESISWPQTSVVDLDRVASWMDEHGIGKGPLTGVHELTGGTQNILVRFTRAGRTFVLRRPAAYTRDNSDETLVRGARVLASLAESRVPHPAFVARCDDPSVIGASFYLMQSVEGFNPTVEMPDVYRRDSSWQVAFAEALVDALLALAAVVPSRVGLADLGHAEGWHARQVARWARQLERYERTDGYRSDLTEQAAQIGRWLTNHPPREHRFGLIHGDFHLANVLFCHDEPALAAIIDWELATQGDPLLDFGQLLATWPVNEHAVDVGPAAPLDDLPGTGVLVE